MSARRFLFSIGLLATVTAAAFRPALSRSVAPPALPSLDSGCWAVLLSAAGIAFDLDLDTSGQFELIVSSLGNASQSYCIRLEAQPRASAEFIPTVRIPPLARTSVGWASPTTSPNAGVAQKEMVGAADRAGQAGENCHTYSPPTGASLRSSPGHTDQQSNSVSHRRFFLHIAATPLEDRSGYVPISGSLVVEGQHVRIYVDSDLAAAHLAAGLVNEIIRLLDDEVVPRSRELLGDVADVDGDGKLAVLITPWLGRLCGGQTAINGCVRASDFQMGVESPFGNSADVIYLNSQLETGPALKTVLAHEYTHAVCFSHRFARDARPLPVEDDWLNEAIAHVAENLHGADWSNLDNRITEFLAEPCRSPLVVADYFRAGLWRDPGCRGATYLFLRFCVDQFGPGLLGKLVRSPLTGVPNIEQATGISFPVLFRHWTIALANDQIASVPLDSTLGNRQLAGVKRTVWRLDKETCTVNLSGTATSLIHLAPTTNGVRRIVVRSPPGAQLQITVLRRTDKK